LAATVGANEFFCLSCRLTAELDIHGRCATCGSDAVTHPLRYRLIHSASDNCCIREKKVLFELGLKNNEEAAAAVFIGIAPGNCGDFLATPILIPIKRGKV
jgi:hypothetical protein